jgi:hypothetical protein
MTSRRSLTKATRKTRNSQRSQEWNSNDESFESKSDDMATIAIKDKASSNKSLFPNLPKNTCLMAKESKKKVKSKASSSPKYVTSDEDTLSSDNYASSDDDDSLSSELVKNLNAMIKDLMRQQEELLVQEREISEELKKLLALQKGKVEKLDQELSKSKETDCSPKSSIGALQDQHDVLLKTHQELKVQFDALWSSTSKFSTNNEASTSQVSVKTCDEQIAQENDHLKREVKKLKLEANKLKKQAKVQPPQDNRNNMVKKLEKGKIHQRLLLNHQRSKFKRRRMKR